MANVVVAGATQGVHNELPDAAALGSLNYKTFIDGPANGANSNGSAPVANKPIGTFSIPSGTTNGTTLTAVSNTVVVATSFISLGCVFGDPGVYVVCVVTAIAANSFTVKVYTGGTTTATVYVQYSVEN